MKVVINKCYGGFGLSRAGIEKYAEIKGIKIYPYLDKYVKDRNIQIDDPQADFWLHWTKIEPTKDNYKELSANDNYFSYLEIERTDPALVQVVEELGERANGRHANLKVIDIPDGVDYEIDEYDGLEHIAESHRTWG